MNLVIEKTEAECESNKCKKFEHYKLAVYMIGGIQMGLWNRKFFCPYCLEITSYYKPVIINYEHEEELNLFNHCFDLFRRSLNENQI